MKILPISKPRYVYFSSNKTNAGDIIHNAIGLEKAKSYQFEARNLNQDNKKEIKALNKKMIECLGAKFDDENQLAIEALHLEDFETIKRFAQVKNGTYIRCLTDDEAWTVSRAYSIGLADEMEPKQICTIAESIKAWQECDRKYNVKQFSDEQINLFLKLKDSDMNFKSSNQIMRFVALVSADSGLSRELNFKEAEYFSKKCSKLNEIQEFIDYVGSNEEIKKIYGEVISKPYRFTFRTLQTSGLKELTLYSNISKDSQLVYTFIDSRLISKVRNEDISQTEVQTYDAFSGTTSFIRYDSIPYKDTRAIYTKNVLEILNAENGTPNKIRLTDFDSNDCIADTKVWDLDEIDENVDVVSAISNNQIQTDNHTLVKTILPNGDIMYEQKFKTDNAILTKASIFNESGWVMKYIISDIDGLILYQTERKFEKTGENSSLTTIDGIKYKMHFMPEEKSIFVIKQGGKTFKIPEIISKDMTYIDYDFDSKEFNSRNQALWNFCKNELPADVALILNNFNYLISPTLDDLDSETTEIGTIFTGCNVGILAHEVGHMLSMQASLGEPGLRISQDETLKSIYETELAKFSENYTRMVELNTIDYYNNTGGKESVAQEEYSTSVMSEESLKALKTSTGLEEIVAEAMCIKTYPFVKNPILSMRTHYLMMNFPRTLAYASILLDELCLNVF